MKTIVRQRASDRRRMADWKVRFPLPQRVRGKGAIAVMFAGFLIIIIGFFGLALDLSRMYNRKAEMHAVADTVAVSAARKLNGTLDGVNAAILAAHDVLEGGDLRPKYGYTQPMVFSETAITFSKSSDGSTGWLDTTAAQATPDGLRYVKVDTSQLNPSYGAVGMMFMPVMQAMLSIRETSSMPVSHVAVAGKSGIGVTPLAICAMSATAAEPRENPGNFELLEHGFRRGVSYNLMQLSSHQDTPTNFLLDPISPPEPASPESNFNLETVGPYVCSGTVALPVVEKNTSVRVRSGFPIGDLLQHLNSRFNLSGGKCNPNTAPPDSNVRQFTPANIGWMSTKPSSQTARGETDTDNKLRTIADLPPPNNQSTPAHYGPLWVFARAVPWSSYVPGKTEPAEGYLPFPATTAIWQSLYSTGPGLNGYPSPLGVDTPYRSQPSPPLTNRPGVSQRRVLNVPLLQCPVSGSTATVLAIGKFFMTVPADSSGIYAEFAGLAADRIAAGQVELK